MKKLIYLLPGLFLLYACSPKIIPTKELQKQTMKLPEMGTTAKDSLAYAIGNMTANNLKDLGVNLKSKQLQAGFDANAKGTSYLTDDGLQSFFKKFSTEMRNRMMDTTLAKTPAMINVDTLSYGMGMDINKNTKDINLDAYSAALFLGNEDVVTGATPKLNEGQIKQQMMAFQKLAAEVATKKADQAAAGNIAKGEAFLAAKGKEPGVMTTESGLMYKVLKEGTGPKPPSAQSTVKVHYVGTLIDGTEFDSSVRRGEPIEFPLSRVIPGWTEGLQLMPTGSKFQFYIPEHLAYGKRGSPPKIGPGATLIFDVELLEVK